MDSSRENIGGILLAGGRSRRMGREKGLVEICGRPLYSYPLSVLESLCAEVLVSSCRPSILVEGHRHVCDEIRDIGPLGGIHACLKQSSHEWNLVLSYDMPLVDQRLFLYLLKYRDANEIVLPAPVGGRPEPLCGLYRKSTVPLIETQIRNKDYAVHRVLEKSRGRVVELSDKLEGWKADIFMNLNSEADLAKLPPDFGSQQHG